MSIDAPLDLRRLATFRTAATTLSFTRTAAEMGYVQSSVTAQIATLEDELGTRLFDRLGKRLALTDSGRRLLPYAKRLLDLATEARDAAAGGSEVRGLLTISAPETVCTYRLPAVLQLFRARYPEVRLRFVPRAACDLERIVLENGVDVGVVIGERGPAAALTSESLCAEPLLLLAAPEHPLAGKSRVKPTDLVGEDVLLTEAGCSYRTLFERSLATHGVRLGPMIEFGSIEAIKQCVIASMGLTVLPAIAAQTEIRDGRLVALRWREPNFSVETQIVLHRDKWLSPALAAFVEVCREVLKENVAEASKA